MKVKSLHITNFGSYKDLEMDLEDSGPTLIHGATGSGKSTLCDIVPWVLFGITSKNGGVDEVRNWTQPDELTEGRLILDYSGVELVVTRRRGKSNENDLFWNEGGTDVRGKNIQETQRLLDKRLGIDASTYLASAYYSEFSPVGGFFLANAKARRETLEKLVDLDLPSKISDRASNQKKLHKKTHQKEFQKFHTSCGKLDQLENSIGKNKIRSLAWEKEHTDKVKDLLDRANKHEQTKKVVLEKITNDINNIENHIGDFVSTCPTCGEKNKNHTELTLELVKLNVEKNQLQNQKNPFQRELISTQKATNPFAESVSEDFVLIDSLKKDLKQQKDNIDHLEHQILSYTQLQDLSSTLRGELLKSAIKSLESSTNQKLEEYFDAELRIELIPNDSDGLDVEVRKSGYKCFYTQLSKGQRCLLKLTFATSVMDMASNKAGIHFDQIFLDEALDGLDVSFKIKAFRLIEDLANRHSSVYLVDHSTELQSMFSTKILVELIGDSSVLEFEK